MARILSINNYHYRRGGSDVVYLDHAALLEGQGWDNAFFSMHHPKNIPNEWSKYFIDELELGHSYSLLSKLIMATKVIYSFEAQRKLRKLLEYFSPDVAHLHCIYHHLSPSILPVLKERHIPTIMTAHDLKIACPAYKMLNDHGICELCNKEPLLNIVKNRCIRNSFAASSTVYFEAVLHRWLDTYLKNLDRVVVPSRFFLEKFVEWGWPREKFSYIPNYVDASDLEPEYCPGSYFLFFGRLAAEKGVATLIRAAASAMVALKIVGTGPIEPQLRMLAEEVGGNVEFVGYLSGNKLHDCIRNSRAVVLPSEWYENAPMSILESYALGKPVIGARIGGIPELVIEGDTGWLFESGNVTSLVDVLSRVSGLHNNDLASVGAMARNFVEDRFNKNMYLNSINSLYAEMGVNC